MLLSTAYFPTVQYLALLARDMTLSPDRVCPSTALMEASERYQKQSYRNRCYILGGDGVEMLQVPVVHAEDMSIRSVRVDWSTPWLVRTERALDTAYYSSAYFEYYRDELFAILEERPERLWDLNLRTLDFLLKTELAEQITENEIFLPWSVKNSRSEGASAERMRKKRAQEKEAKLQPDKVSEQCDGDSEQCAHNVTDNYNYNYSKNQNTEERDSNVPQKNRRYSYSTHRISGRP